MAAKKKGQPKRGARKPNPSRRKAKVSDEAQPHKLLGDLVALKYNKAGHLAESRSLQFSLFRPDFRRGRKILQEAVEAAFGEGFVASMFAGELWGARLNGKGEIVGEGPMGPFEFMQAHFGEIESQINRATQLERKRLAEGGE